MVANNKRHKKASSLIKVEKARIVTSIRNVTLAIVSYEKYTTRVPDGVAYGIYEWLSSQ